MTTLVGFPQTPFVQVSPVVHALPSSHAVPFPAVVPTQVPFWQLSPVVHELPSSHAVPFVRGTGTHWPVTVSHVDPPVWHWAGKGFGGQMTGEPTQVPLWHASAPVHLLPSSQVVPFAFGGFEHRPVDGTHVPGSWH